MNTVDDLYETMQDYEDAGVSIQIQEAISNLLEVGKLELNEVLSPDVLSRIILQIHENTRNRDTVSILFGGLIGKTSNVIEAATQYIENLQSATYA